MPKTVAVIGTLDTKGDQIEYLKQLIEARGLQVCVIDVGVIGDQPFEPAIDHEQVARAAGLSLDQIITLDDPNAHFFLCDVITMVGRGVSSFSITTFSI